MEFMIDLLSKMAFASIPSLGFGMMFHVPRRALKYCAILASCGYGTKLILMHFSMPLLFATFFAASLIGFLGVYLSHRFLVHPKVFTVAAIIPMIPGVPAYKAMIAMVQIYNLGYSEALLQELVNYFIQTSFLLGALAFGLSLPGMLFYRNKPVV